MENMLSHLNTLDEDILEAIFDELTVSLAEEDAQYTMLPSQTNADILLLDIQD